MTIETTAGSSRALDAQVQDGLEFLSKQVELAQARVVERERPVTAERRGVDALAPSRRPPSPA